ncbi:filamentous hemagglutinin / adhesin [Fusarium austroafricanum]|uniref:Filamentous hemagglutinin / adhesin n=1 Tax=Fusarium austroafricanum TaxID=2364996 RepID=A0A8H4NRD6_9HYPO|nr:filamentous hemagglutinin / adhesin [Fusarium austroafricanum]
MLVSFLLSSFLCISTVTALPNPILAERAPCDCTGTRDGGSSSKAYICRDARLGPEKLPKKLPLSTFVESYNRFGGLTPAQFLQKWTDEKGSYKYPPQNGFQLDANGHAINGTMVLQPGTLVDRFGSAYGSFISAAAAPYSQRALPPSNLDTNPDTPDFPYNYHLYVVIKPLTVVGGPIAPWFGQPGLGAQFFTGETGNVKFLLEQNYLKEEHPSTLIYKSDGCA